MASIEHTCQVDLHNRDLLNFYDANGKKCVEYLVDQNPRSCLKQPTEQSFIHSIDKLIGDRKNLKKSIHRASGAPYGTEA